MKRVIEPHEPTYLITGRSSMNDKSASFVKQLCQSYPPKKIRKRKEKERGGERRGRDKDALSRGHRIINILVG